MTWDCNADAGKRSATIGSVQVRRRRLSLCFYKRYRTPTRWFLGKLSVRSFNFANIEPASKERHTLQWGGRANQETGAETAESKRRKKTSCSSLVSFLGRRVLLLRQRWWQTLTVSEPNTEARSHPTLLPFHLKNKSLEFFQFVEAILFFKKLESLCVLKVEIPMHSNQISLSILGGISCQSACSSTTNFMSNSVPQRSLRNI